MTATAVFLFGIVHICRLAAAALLICLAWEFRRRPSVWLFGAVASCGLGYVIGEFLQLARLSQEPPAVQAYSQIWIIPAVLHAASLAFLAAWGMTTIGRPGLAWAPWLAMAPGWLVPLQNELKISIALAVTGLLFAKWASRVQRHAAESQFFRRFGSACCTSSATLLLPEPFGPAAFALSSLSLPLLLLHGIERRNLFDLRASRRLLFVGTLGLGSAIYLLTVQRIADQLSWEYGRSRAMVEVILIMAAAVLWLPLYEWMSRRMARRAEVHIKFSKKVIEEAAELLDPNEQIQFLAGGLALTLGCPRLLLATRGKGMRLGSAGMMVKPADTQTEWAIEAASESGEEMLHQATAPSDLRVWLEAHQFHYLLPLRHESKTIGALFLDVSPRRYLSDLDPMFPAMCRDVSLLLTTSRLAEEKVLLERELMAQEGRAALGDLTAIIAHEIKNPLSTIRALAQLMREDPEVGVKYDRDLEYIVQESERLDGSVRQLLEFARPPGETPADVDISTVLERAVRKLSVDAASGGLILQCSIAPGLIVRSVDERSVEQVALNILQNAVHASPHGGKVEITAAQHDGTVTMTVLDEGSGIPESVQEKIFRPYFTTKQCGTGLGLAIVKRNLRRLHGTVRVESPVADGRGTRMHVSLPVQRTP